MERIEMSVKEVKRLEVMRQLSDGVVSQVKAAETLGLSDRQVRRLHKRYEALGAAGLVSNRRGQPSNNRLPFEFREAVMGRLQARYPDFGPTLAAEYLRGDGLDVSKETLRLWMIEAKLWKPAKGRRTCLHPPRPRRPCLGELIQIDGSPHDWFEGRGPRCTLIAFIDDATSRVMHAHFVPVESTQAYLTALQAYITTYGRPAALYSDRHGIFTKHDPEDAKPTQFQRATNALEIAAIQALTPQAKGRVERLFQTLQDRLVKALRLAGINDLVGANAFLPAYLSKHNERFAVSPADNSDGHRPYAGNAQQLARICAIHHERKLSKDLVISFNRQRYIIQTGGQPRYALRGQTITVVVYPDARIELVYGDEVLPFTVFDASQAIGQPVDDKTLNARVDDILKGQGWNPKSRPVPNHPWRRFQISSRSDTGQRPSP